MKPRILSIPHRLMDSNAGCLIRLGMSLALCSAIVNAGTFNWDSDANAANGAGGGAGTWNTTNTNWYNGTSDVAWPNVSANDDKAVFGGTAGTVTLGSSLTAGGIQFDTSGYTLSGALDLTLSPQVTGSDALVVSAGVSNVSINLRKLILTASGSGAIGDLINTDKVDFGNTIVAFSGSRQMTLSNSTTSATTTFTNFAVGSGSPGGASLYLNQGNLTITNFSASTSTSALSAANSTSTTAGIAFRGTGSGKLTLSGNNTLLNNAGTGTLAVNFLNANATYEIGHDNALGARDASNNLTDTYVEFGVGTLTAINGARNIANTVTHTGTFTIGGNNAVTLGGMFTNSGGNRTLIVNNSAATTLSGSVFLANDNTTARTWAVAGSGNTTVSGVIANNNAGNSLASNLTMSGTGTLSLSNSSNTYTGITNISSGVVSVGTLANGGSSSSIGASSNAAANLVIGASGTLKYTGSTVSIDRGFTSSAGAKIEVTDSGANLELTSTSIGTFTKTGSGTLTLSGALAGASAPSVTGGTLVLNAPTNNAFSGSITVGSGGTMKLGSASTGDMIHDNTAVTVNGGGMFDMGGESEKVKNISGTGTFINSGSTQSTLTVSGYWSSSVFDGTITGNIGLTHSDGLGSATTLNGLNTYSGNTTIGAGDAILNLGSTGGLTFYIGDNGVNNWIHGASGATVNLDGLFAFDLTNAAIVNGNFWNIVEVGDLVETFGSTFAVTDFTEASNVWTKADGNNTWTFTESTGVLSLAVIPEPSAALLGSLGIFALLRRRRI